MSSAILYVAIVAIWAGVLIPRWLRRDSSASASTPAAEADQEVVVDSGAEEEPEWAPPVSAPPRRRPPERRPVPAVPEVPVSASVSFSGADEDREAPDDRTRRRVVSARRRLLLMLLALGTASGALYGARMAAWWVVVPPSVMLFGYLLLLRAAAKADRERREMAQHQTARAAAEPARAPLRREAPARQAHARQVPARQASERQAPARQAAPRRPVASASPAARASRPPEATIITIPAAPDPDEFYDQYADAKLRAVGD